MAEQIFQQESTPAELAHLQDRYTQIRLIGEGGNAKVCKAHDNELLKWVAIKLLATEHLTAEQVMRFQNEARILSKLNHPNLVSIIDIGVSPAGKPYQVMEFIEGKSLKDLLEELSSNSSSSSKTLSIANILEICLQVCQGMKYAHKHGIVHRDLKPANILVQTSPNGDSIIKVLDFGIAKSESNSYKNKEELEQDLCESHSSQWLSQKSGSLVGSPCYMAPEQINKEPVDPRTDIYAIGCLLFELVSGRPPYLGDSIIETLSQHCNAPLPPIDSRTEQEVGEELKSIIYKCLAKNPKERFQKIEELSNALAHELEKEKSKIDSNKSTIESFETHRDEAQTVPSNSILQPKYVFCAIALVAIIFSSFALQIFSASKKKEAAIVMHSIEPTLLGTSDSKSPFTITMKNGKVCYEADPLNGVSDEDLAKLPENLDIDTLDLARSKITGKGFEGKLGWRVNRVNLKATSVNDAGLANLGKIESIDRLDLDCTQITDKGLEHIAGLPKLRGLRLGSCDRITGDGLKMLIANASGLETLDLGGCRAVASQLSCLQDAPRLRKLILSSMDLNDADLESLGILVVEDLSLSVNKNLTDRSLKMLEKYPNLTNLSLAFCPLITETAIAEFEKRNPRCKIETRNRYERKFSEDGTEAIIELLK